MVHVSNMAPYRVEKVTDIVKMGDKVQVKVMELSPDGKISLSMKDAPGNVYPEKPAAKPFDPSAPKPPAAGGDRRPPARRP